MTPEQREEEAKRLIRECGELFDEKIFTNNQEFRNAIEQANFKAGIALGLGFVVLVNTVSHENLKTTLNGEDSGFEIHHICSTLYSHHPSEQPLINVSHLIDHVHATAMVYVPFDPEKHTIPYIPEDIHDHHAIPSGASAPIVPDEDDKKFLNRLGLTW